MIPEPDNEAALEDIEGVYPELAPDHEIIQQVKTEFQPWHHPRKQYVRIYQWCQPIRQLINELRLGEGDSFRYLTLPGSEMLDIRAIQGVCAPAGIKLRYLGFNKVLPGSGEHAELNLSQNEVRALASIDQFSSVVEDRLETVANQRSTAFERTKRSAPFHTINIDLCDSIAHRDPDHPKGSYLEVLRTLLELQLQTQTSWLLFLTTRAEPELISERWRKGFMDAIAANTAASAEFKAELSGLIATAVDQLEIALDRTWLQQESNFLRLYCTGLGKWLIRLLGNTAPPRELILLSSCYYQVGPAGPDMLSLVFRCNAHPQRINDRDGLLDGAEAIPAYSETAVAVQLVKDLSSSFDLDRKLLANTELCDNMIAKAGRLLAKARYSEDEYRRWARNKLGLVD